MSDNSAVRSTISAMEQTQWERLDLPVLRAIAADTADQRGTSLHDLASITGFGIDEVARSLENLTDAHYIEAQFLRGADEIVAVHDVRLRERGMRATGVWPPDEAYQTFLDVIERMAEAEPNPERKSKLRKVGEAVAGLGSEVAGNVIAAVVTRVAGLG